MEINKLRLIIKEAVTHGLKEIEEAAENAAMDAKLKAYTEAIEKVNNKIETAESLEEMQELVDPAKLNELKKHLKLLEKSKEKLIAKGFDIDYIEITDEILNPITNADKNQTIVALIAASIGEVRLIDNMILNYANIAN
jgi:pantothenate synthetase